MRIAYVTNEDPDKINSFSGTHFHIYKQLKSKGYDVVKIGPVVSKWRYMFAFYKEIVRIITGKHYSYLHTTFVAKSLAKIISRRIRKTGSIDLIIASNASTAIAYLETDIPIIYSTDGTFRLLSDYHNVFKNLTKKIYEEGDRIEQLTLDKAEKCVFSSQWAANSALRHYEKDEKKIEVLPFGANLKEWDSQKLEKKRIDIDEVNLLFVGVNWQEKGGPKAVEALNYLLSRGINAKLHVCGVTPPVIEDSVIIHGFLDKTKDDDLEKLISLYQKADFFVLPTSFECYGIVMVEALSFGTPCLATDTGGVSTIIQEGKNGFLFNENASGLDYGIKIEEIMQNLDLYKRLSQNALHSYRNKLNWNLWGDRIDSIIREILDDESINE